MLGLVNEKEFGEVFDGYSSHFLDTTKLISRKGWSTYRKRMNFFTPYKNGAHLAGELIAPVLYPAYGLVLSAVSLIVTPFAALIGLGCLLFAGGATLFGYKGQGNRALDCANLAFAFSGISLLTAIISAILGLLSFFNSLASLLTRSITTLVSLGSPNSEVSNDGINAEAPLGITP